MPKGFEIEGVEVAQINEHITTQAYERSIDDFVLDSVNHNDQQDKKEKPHYKFSHCSYSSL